MLLLDAEGGKHLSWGLAVVIIAVICALVGALCWTPLERCFCRGHNHRRRRLHRTVALRARQPPNGGGHELLASIDPETVTETAETASDDVRVAPDVPPWAPSPH